MNRFSLSLHNERCEMCLAYTEHSRKVHCAFRLPLSAVASSLSEGGWRKGKKGLSQALRSNRSSRSIDDKRCPIHCTRLHSGAYSGCSVQRKSREREKEEKSEKTTRCRSRRGWRREEKRLSRCGELQRVAQKEAIARHT